jgi:hypothetical protein
MGEDEEKLRRAKYGPRYTPETAERVYKLLAAGVTVLKISVETGLSENQICLLRAGGSKNYRDLYLKYAEFLPKHKKLGPIGKPFGWSDDGFILKDCAPGLQRRADSKLLLDPWAVYKLSLSNPNLMPMRPPPKSNGNYRAVMKDITANKHRGSPESVAAFKRVEGYIAKEQALVLSVLFAHSGGLTAQEIEDLLGLSCCSVSARMAELKKAGVIARKLLRVSPEGSPVYLRRKNRSGATAGVYIVQEGANGS